MKRSLILLLAVLLLLLTACGDISHMEILPYESELYTDREIDAAIDATAAYFKKNFSGCTLREITYAGDETSMKHIDWAERNDADDVIVLISSFDVDASGGDASLNPNSTYRNWMWILVRRGIGPWRHVDHGY